MQKLFGDVAYKNSSIFIINDTLFMFQPSQTKVPQYSISIILYDHQNKCLKLVGDFKNDTTENIYKQFNLASSSTLQIKNIGSPAIKNPAVLDSANRLVDGRNILSTETRIHSFGDKYFLIDNIFPNSIKMLDKKTSRVDSFNIKNTFFEITDFFLYDLDKDGEPEIFIFSVGRIPKKDVVSLDVYSIRKDSVRVAFE
ncbi:MAG: hypothetical protein JST87_17950 [Bacteroidetes bacterium]|nr:hypothetical protein [Bacteroidota bacterium]MBS1934981.1 hypothetical protein [Bacteroidota bacterium]